MHIETQADDLQAETRQATVFFTRRVHIKNQANSHAETRQATFCHQKSAHYNQANSPTETRQATVCVTSRVHIENQVNSLSVK